LLVGAISSVGPLGLDVVGLTAHLRIASGNMPSALYLHSLILCSACMWHLQEVETDNEAYPEPNINPFW